MFKLYRFVFMMLFLASLTSAQGYPFLDEVLESCRKSLPVAPSKADSLEETAFRATTFIYQFLEEDKKNQIKKSVETIEPTASLDSLFDQMRFHHFYGERRELKELRDQKIGSTYRTLLKALQNKEPIVGYLYGLAFKSAYIYDPMMLKGKVLSRNIDLQELIEFETYKHIEKTLKALGFDFHFVIIRDTFHAISLNLSNSGEKIYDNANEILEYGKQIHKISNETGITTLDIHDLENCQGQSLSSFISENLNFIMEKAKDIPSQDISGFKGFLRREYEYESLSGTQKDKQAILRAKRYSAMKTFVKDHEGGFLYPTLRKHFGPTVCMLPFSIHVEDYIGNCIKIPLNTIQNFIGGCNAQHQLPLLQK